MKRILVAAAILLCTVRAQALETKWQNNQNGNQFILYNPIQVGINSSSAPVAYSLLHAYDSRAATANYFWSEPTKIVIQNPDATGLGGIMFANNQGFPGSLTGNTWYERNASIFYSGDSYPGVAGGGKLIFSVPQGFGGQKGFAFMASGLRRLTHSLVGSTTNTWNLTQVDNYQPTLGGRTTLKLDQGDLNQAAEFGVTSAASTLEGNPWNVNDTFVLYKKGVAAINLAIDVTGTPTPVVQVGAGGAFSLYSLNAGGMVKAGAATGTLAIASAGTDYQAPMSAADATVVFPTTTTIRRAAITGDVSIPAASNASVVQAITETSGPTSLVIGTITDGEFLKRSGATLVSASVVPATRTVQGTAPIQIAGDNAAHDLSANRVWSLATNGVTDTFLRQGGALSVIGRSANSTGNVADISAATNGDVLRVASSVLGFGAIPESSVTNLVTDLAGKVPTSRTITTTGPIRIDGGASADLSANRTLSITGLGGSNSVVTSPTTTSVGGDSGFTYDGSTVTLVSGVRQSFTTGADQAFYNATGANSEDVRFFWSSNTFTIKSEKSGAGTVRPIVVDGNGASVTVKSDAGGAIVSSSSDFAALASVLGSAPDVLVDPSRVNVRCNGTLASASTVTWNSFDVDGLLTLTGSTTVSDPSGVNFTIFGTPEIATAATVGTASTLKIEGPPFSSGGGSITNTYPFWVAGGIVRIDGGVSLGGGSTATLGTIGGSGPTAPGQWKWLPIYIDGTAAFIPLWI